MADQDFYDATRAARAAVRAALAREAAPTQEGGDRDADGYTVGPRPRHAGQPHAATCVICKGTEGHKMDCPNRVALAFAERFPGMTRDAVPVDQATRAAVLEAVANSADLQRRLDVHHLGTCVVQTDLGPAVLWRDVERVMPLPLVSHDPAPYRRQHRLET